MAVDTLSGWTLHVERGPDWLFVRPLPPHAAECGEAELAEAIYELMNQHFTYRLVLEMDEVPLLRSWFIGQLVLLHKRVTSHDGVVRLSGLSDANHDVLRFCRLHDRFPQYATRYSAIMGQRPTKPR